MATVRVLIRSRSPRALENDRGLLGAERDLSLVTDPTQADVTLLDLTDDGDEALPALPPADGRVLILLPESAPASLLAEALASDASVVTDEVSRDQLLQALRAVASGLRVRSRAPVTVGVPLRAHPAPPTAQPSGTLTPRERDILRLLGEGLANRDIAARLSLSDHTVKFHLRAVFAKLGARSRTEAVSIAVRKGLLML